MASLMNTTSILESDLSHADEPAKKRRRRNRLTCHACQRSKSKCIREEEESSAELCERCRKRGEVCTYDEPAALPVKADPALVRMLSAHEARIKKLEDQLRSLTQPTQLAASAADDEDRLTDGKAEPLEGEDATEAINALESIALGRSQQYNALGLNKELPTRAGSLDLAASDLSSFGSHWTSIIDPTKTQYQDLRYLQAVPPVPVCDALVALFFTECVASLLQIVAD